MGFSKILTLAVFFIAYYLFITKPKIRWAVALSAITLLVLSPLIDFLDAIKLINWNVIGIFWGTLVLAELFMRSNMPSYLAEWLVRKAPRAWMAMLGICLLTGFLSIFIENVATVLLMAPIAFSIAEKLKISPTVLFISIAISSNLQGAATLIGDPPSMILAGYMRMGFNDFFIYHGRLSMFFFVQLGAITSAFVLYWFFRRYRASISLPPTEEIRSMAPTYMMIMLIISLAIASFLDPGFGYLAGIVCVVWAIIGIAWHHFSGQSVGNLLKVLDWNTTIFLMGVFVIVGALAEAGWLAIFANWMGELSGASVPFAFILILVISMLVSGFVDNVPYLVAMIPVVQNMVDMYGLPLELMVFGLLIGASLGGNITPIGASANIIAMGYLRQRKYDVGFLRFVRIGLPYTLVATGSAAAFLWIIWR